MIGDIKKEKKTQTESFIKLLLKSKFVVLSNLNLHMTILSFQVYLSSSRFKALLKLDYELWCNRYE